MAETTTIGKGSAESLSVCAMIFATRRIRSPLPTEVPPNFRTCTCDCIRSPINRIESQGDRKGCPYHIYASQTPFSLYCAPPAAARNKEKKVGAQPKPQVKGGRP